MQPTLPTWSSSGRHSKPRAPVGLHVPHGPATHWWHSGEHDRSADGFSSSGQEDWSESRWGNLLTSFEHVTDRDWYPPTTQRVTSSTSGRQAPHSPASQQLASNLPSGNENKKIIKRWMTKNYIKLMTIIVNELSQKIKSGCKNIPSWYSWRSLILRHWNGCSSGATVPLQIRKMWVTVFYRHCLIPSRLVFSHAQTCTNGLLGIYWVESTVESLQTAQLSISHFLGPIANRLADPILVKLTQ